MPATASRGQRWRAYDYGARDVSERDNASAGLLRALYEAQQAGGGIVELDSGVVIQTRSTLTIPAGVELVIPAGTTLRGAAGLVGDVVAIAAAAANAGRVTGGGTVDGNRAAGLTGNAVSATNAADAVVRVNVTNAYLDGLALVGCSRPVLDVVASANGRHGIYHSATSFGRGQVTARDNGQRTAGSGVVFADSTDNAYSPIVATDTRSGGSKTQLYGVLETGTSDRNPISASSLAGNATGPTLLVGASSGSAIVPGSIGAAAIADGSVGTAELADGAVSTAKIADGAATNAKLAADVARANLLTNGGFEIWQRGGGTYTVSGTTTADRWAANSGGGSTYAISPLASTIGRAGYSLQLVYTHAAGGYAQINQRLEGSNQLRGRPVAYSIKVKSTVVGTVNLRLLSVDASAVPTVVASMLNTTANAEETLTVTGTVPANSAAIYLDLVVSTASCTVELNDATVVAGSVPADYVPLHPHDELDRCLRYYELMGATISSEMMGVAQAWAATQCILPLFWKVKKATTPTVTVSAYNQWGLLSNAGGNVAPTGVTGWGSWGINSGALQFSTAGGLVGGNAVLVTGSSSAPGYVTAEANP